MLGATHTCTLYHCLLMDTLWCWFRDKTIKPYVLSANTMRKKCSAHSERAFCALTCNVMQHFFHFREWHMNDGKIKVSAPAMSKHPLMQLTYQHMESFFLRDVTSQPRTSKETGPQKQRAWAVSKEEWSSIHTLKTHLHSKAFASHNHGTSVFHLDHLDDDLILLNSLCDLWGSDASERDPVLSL